MVLSDRFNKTITHYYHHCDKRSIGTIGASLTTYCPNQVSWWRHQIEALSALLALCEGNPPVTGGFPSQRPVTRGFDVSFDLRLNNRLSKQSRRWWFETPSISLWRHCDDISRTFQGTLQESWMPFVFVVWCCDLITVGCVHIPELVDPWGCRSHFKIIIFKFVIQNSSLDTHCEITLRWMPQNILMIRSALVQIMALRHQATSHYLSQC